MTKEIYLAGGCYWGTEHFVKQIQGVKATTVGFANGHGEYPSYEQVCTHTTGFAETVRVEYDDTQVPLTALLDLFFMMIDPTSLNRQGEDVGDQYRTGVFFVDAVDKPTIDAALARLAQQYDQPLVVEVCPLVNFYPAEESHQDYLDKHPQGYCHVDPRLFEVAKKYKAPK